MHTNRDMDSGAPFAALLIGQPTLRQRLRLGVLAALDQRISVRYALAGVNSAETAGHVTHHFKIAGAARHPVQRRRAHPDPQRLPQLPPRGEQLRRQRTHRREREQQSDRRRKSSPHRDLRNRRLTSGVTTPTKAQITGNVDDAIIGKINDGQQSRQPRSMSCIRVGLWLKIHMASI